MMAAQVAPLPGLGCHAEWQPYVPDIFVRSARFNVNLRIGRPRIRQVPTPDSSAAD